MNLKEIKGIGPKAEIILKNKGINNIESLIYFIPNSYIEYKLTPFSLNKEMNVKATVLDEVSSRKLKTATKVSFLALVEGVNMKITLFNKAYLKNILKIGTEIVIVGTYEKEYNAINASKVFLLKDYKEGILPEYQIEGMANSTFQKIVGEALKKYQIKNSFIPHSYFEKNGYLYGIDLLKAVHFPSSIKEAYKAIDALKYYELLTFSLKMKIIRMQMEKEKKIPKNPNTTKVKEFIDNNIKFELTTDQKKAVNDIFIWFRKDVPMNMLLEGDVGSGKTIVALICSYAAHTSAYQSLLLVPTEALGLQHYKTFKEYLEDTEMNVRFLSSSTKAKERKEILDSLKDGSIDLIIGTHSLLSKEVVFKNLGFVICDEQHKFGVDQRKIIREKGNNPDILYMTATPIPRTLSLTYFSDMTLSTIKVLPKNRKKIYTKAYTYRDYLKVLSFVKSEIDDGRQAFFVAPIIDDNEGDLVSVNKIKTDLESYFKDVKIGLLHGKQLPSEKENTISSFMRGETKILVSTTVIEVGIDNPNASVMVIIDAQQFGLSSLHQLRGRVGRGSFEGYCFLMVNKKEFLEKLRILEETSDGFLISEEDLRQRGPGDFLGTEQSGFIKFRFADLKKDERILEIAIRDSIELIKDKEIFNYFIERIHNSNNFD